MLRAPRVPAGKPVGPGSGRWLSRVDPTAVGVVNGVVGGEAVSVPRPRIRPSSRWSAFSFGQRVESRLRKTTRPGRALSGDREGSKGLPVDRKRPEGRFRWPGGKLLPGLGFTGARLARVLPRGVLGSNRNRGRSRFILPDGRSRRKRSKRVASFMYPPVSKSEAVYGSVTEILVFFGFFGFLRWFSALFESWHPPNGGFSVVVRSRSRSLPWAR